jgi:hypothetical protein
MVRRHHSAIFKRLHELEVEGESVATPAIALAEVVLFLLPIFAFLLTVTFVAYYLAVEASGNRAVLDGRPSFQYGQRAAVT